MPLSFTGNVPVRYGELPEDAEGEDEQIDGAEDDERLRPALSEVMKLVSDNARARKVIGWLPTVSIDDGLRRTIEFVRENPSLYQTDRYVR